MRTFVGPPRELYASEEFNGGKAEPVQVNQGVSTNFGLTAPTPGFGAEWTRSKQNEMSSQQNNTEYEYLQRFDKHMCNVLNEVFFQFCVSANRIFVHEKIHDQYVSKLAAAMKEKLVLGNGMDPKTTQGPLVNQKAVDKCELLLSDALGQGAEFICGGKRGEHGSSYEPTLITNVQCNTNIANTEIFGPIAPIQKFREDDEVLQAANRCRVGLAGYIFGRDPSRLHKFSKRLEVGMIGVNEGLISCAEAAFGGAKKQESVVKEVPKELMSSPTGNTFVLNIKLSFVVSFHIYLSLTAMQSIALIRPSKYI